MGRAVTDEQRLYLLDLLKKGQAKARMLTQARILLLSADGKTDGSIAEVLKVNPQTWTMQLLADRLVELGVVESISDETVRRVLKKQAQALAEEAVVYRSGDGRLRVADGRCS